MIIKLTKKDLKKIEFNQTNIETQNLNKKIQNRNITGCLNIVDSDFKIENVIINGSNCEDGLNIVKSTGQIENLKIKNALSDGVDFDYSNLKIGNADIDNAKGDCLDFSFGKYKIINGNLNNCSDKAISVGETSNLTANTLNILNSKIGIASKDNSKVEINKINLKNLEYCLSAYNKKKEFGGGSINFINMKCNNFIEKYYIGHKSKILQNGKSVQ